MKPESNNLPTLENIVIYDMFDIDELQELQNVFSDAHEVASIITQPDGSPITKSSNFCRLCNRIIRKSTTGMANCIKSDAIIGKQNKNRATIAKCINAGLWDAGVSINIGGVHVANWLIGQIRDNEIDTEKIYRYADEIGTNRQEFMKAYKEVPVMPIEKFRKITKLLYVFVNQISDKAYKNYLLIKEKEFEKQREEYYRLLIENSTDVISILDRNGKIIFQSAAHEKILGYKHGELIGGKGFELMHQEDVSRNKKVLVELVKKPNNKADFNFRYKHKNGKWVYLEGAIKNLLHIPEVNGVLANYRDVTERVENEKLIEHANNELLFITENLPNVIWKCEVSAEGNYINMYVSAIVDEFLGLPKGTINNSFEKYFSFVLPEYTKQIFARIQEGVRNPGKAYIISYPVRKFDGNIIWVESTGRAYQINNKTQIFGITKDITEERRAHLYYDGFFEQSINLNLITGFGGEIVKVNNAWGEILGYLKEELINIIFLDFVHPDDREKTVAEMKRLESGKRTFYFENRYKHKNGTYRLLAWSASANLEENIFLGTAKDITERRNVENKLIEQNEKLIEAKEVAVQNEYRFKALHNASFGGIAIHYKGKIMDCNDGLSKLSGFSHEELINKDGLLLIAEESRAMVAGKIEAGYERPYEAYAIRKNGEKYQARLEARMIPYNGEKARVVEFRDITAQKRLEEQQVRREQLLNETGRLAKIGGWELDVPTMTSYYSLETKRIYGLSPEEPLPEGIEGMKYFPEEVQPLIQKVVKDAIEKGESYDIEVPFVNKQGESLWIRTVGIPEKIDGKVTRLYGTFQDISERKKAEETNSKLTTAIDQSPECIVITDLEGNIEYVNPAFHETTGYSKDEVIGNSTRILSSGYHDSKFYEEIWDTLSHGNTWQGEFYNKKKNGDFYWEHASITPVKNNHGEVMNYLAVKEDITERKKTLEELKEAKENAEESGRLKSAFLANMSHEIRTPMNGILGFLDLIQSSDFSDIEKASFIETVNENGERLLTTISDIIEFSKIEAGDIPLLIQEVDIRETIDRLLSIFKPEIDNKGLSISSEIEEIMAQALVLTDKKKLESILTNLIKNSIKFTKSGNIVVGCKVKGGNLEFFVSDSGCGIKKDKLALIFERFIQAETDITRGYEGSGLGLAICKAYVEKLDGEIWAESENEKGSTFYFTMKYNLVNKEKDTRMKEVITMSDENTQQTAEKQTILVAEDDQASFYYLEVILKKENFNVIYAANGQEAVNLYFDNPNIDLILMDIKMPILNGYEATKQIRAIDTMIPIIAQTAHALPEDVEMAINAGCNDCVTKPIKKKILIDKIKIYMENRTE